MGNVPTVVNVDSIRKNAYIYSIRATAGLLYWAANEMNLFSTVKKVPENYSTIQAAVNASVSVDVIVVSSGTHNINSSFTIPTGVQVAINNGVTLNINSGATVTVNGELNTSTGGNKNFNLNNGNITINGSANWNESTFNLTNSTIAVNSSLEWNRSTAFFTGSNLNVVGVFTPSSMNITFGSTASLSVSGTLNSFSSIFSFNTTSSFSVSGTLNGSSNSTFQGNGSMGSWSGIITTSTNSTVYQSLIKDALIGISVNSTVTSISTNEIRNCSTAITSNNCYNFCIQGNKLLYNDIGLKFTGNAWGFYFPANILVDNDNNIYIEEGSHPDFGAVFGQGRNSIYNAEPYDIISYYSGRINARYNWWGGYQSTPIHTGDVDHDGSLDEDPNPMVEILPEKHTIADILTKKSSLQNSDGEDGIKEFDAAKFLFVQKKNDEAEKSLKYVLNKYPDKLSGRLALITLNECLKQEKKETERFALLDDIKIKNTDRNLTSLAAHIKAKNYIENSKSELAPAELIEIINTNPDFENMPFVLYDLASVYYFTLGNKTEGEKYYSELIEKYPDKDITKSAMAIMHIGKSDYKSQETLSKNTSISSTKLLGNYPNPFNPSTIISYNLSENTNVSIKIYDVLGREVKTLVNEFKPKGSYEVKFNGNGFASGLYFYKLKAGNTNQIMKMILTK